MDNLKILLENIKSIGFWQRLFSWKKIREQLVDATADLQRLITNYSNLHELKERLNLDNADHARELRAANAMIIRQEEQSKKLNETLQDYNNRLSEVEKTLASRETIIKNQEEKINELMADKRVLTENNLHLGNENKRLSEETATNSESITNLSNRKNELEIEIAKLRTDLKNLLEELTAVKKRNFEIQSNEDSRRQEHLQQTATLKSIQEDIQSAREKEIQEKYNAEIEHLNDLKLTWSYHQETVKQTIKSLCAKHTVEYVDKVSFRGEPDNTLKICDEFIIFDSKSPRNEDLSNFPLYLKKQSEEARKYAKEENVKKWIFFVVPANTLGIIKTFVYSLGDYDVFVITVDSLEPVILSLKRIEDYEFAEQLSPEERENICRILGKFAHLSKRRIQIDAYFINQFIELAYKCESDLPPDIHEKVIEFEKAEKLNPPLEKRAKAINTMELEKSTRKIRIDAATKGIIIEDDKISIGLNELQLYKEESE